MAIQTPRNQLSPLQVRILWIRMGFEGVLPRNRRELFQRLFPDEEHIPSHSFLYSQAANAMSVLDYKIQAIWDRKDVVHEETAQVLLVLKQHFHNPREATHWAGAWKTTLPGFVGQGDAASQGAPAFPTENGDCPHHWLLESPNGPTSMGTCRVCGEVREFKNSIKITAWESRARLKSLPGEAGEDREKILVSEEVL